MAGDHFNTALLAPVVTKLEDLARKFDPGDNWPKWIPLILPIAFGIASALIWQVNTLAEIGGSTSRLQGIAGLLITGALIGGFGAVWHEVFDALSSAAKGSRVKAGLPVKGARR